MAFSAEELRVLRGALAIAGKSTAEPQSQSEECRQLAQDVEAATREGSRLRSFLLADLARHRAALPGSATGYLEQLEDALAAGYLPRPDDLAALRMLCADPVTDGHGDESGGEGIDEAERRRRAELLERGERLAEQAVRARLLVLPGGRSASPEEHVSGAVERTEPGAVGPEEAPSGYVTTRGAGAERTDGEVRSGSLAGECAAECAPEHEAGGALVHELPVPGEPEQQDGEQQDGAEYPPSPGEDLPEPPLVADAPAAEADSPEAGSARTVPTPAEVFPPRRQSAQPHQEALLA